MALRQGAKLTFGGIDLGPLLSVGISRLVSGMLFEVETSGAAVFVMALFGAFLAPPWCLLLEPAGRSDNWTLSDRSDRSDRSDLPVRPCLD